MNYSKNLQSEKLNFVRENSEKSAESPSCSKKVVDTLLYDVLDLLPDATEAEIKKAYRKKALKYHPDRNQDEESKEIFQKMNFSYQFLSDSHKRFLYDSQGNAAIGLNSVFSKEIDHLDKDNQTSSTEDADKKDNVKFDRNQISIFFQTFFGSTVIEELVGDLRMFSIYDNLSKQEDPVHQNKNIQEFEQVALDRLKQIKRENFLANNLLKKIKFYTQYFVDDSSDSQNDKNIEDQENDFNTMCEKIEVEIEDLIQNQLGNYFLQVISNVYIQTATKFLKSCGKSKNKLSKKKCSCQCKLCLASSKSSVSHANSFLSSTLKTKDSSSSLTITNSSFKTKYSLSSDISYFGEIYSILNLSLDLYQDNLRSQRLYEEQNLPRAPSTMKMINLKNFLSPTYQKEEGELLIEKIKIICRKA